MSNYQKKDFECHKCNKTFTKTFNLKRHLNTCADKKTKLDTPIKTVRKYNGGSKCEYCGKNFSRRANLNLHVKSYCKQKPEPIKEESIQIDEIDSSIQVKKISRKDAEINRLNVTYQQQLSQKDNEINRLNVTYQQQLSQKDNEINGLIELLKQHQQQMVQKDADINRINALHKHLKLLLE